MYKLIGDKIRFNGKFDVNELECIGSGANAIVYTINFDSKKYALKIFDIPGYWNSKEIGELMNISIESFIMPEKKFYLNHRFRGYLMKFCNGKSLNKEKLNITIGEFINSSKKLLSDTNRLSELNYVVENLSLDNLIYDNGFKVIDTDLFEYQPNNKKIKEFNKKEMTILLLTAFINGIGLDHAFNRYPKLNNLKNNCINNGLSFITFVKIICELVYDKNKYNDITLSDLGIKLKEELGIEEKNYRNISF